LVNVGEFPFGYVGEIVAPVSDTLTRGSALCADEAPALLTREYWEEVFAGGNPWDCANSQYESWKLEQTLSLLPSGPIGRALELACAEGHHTSRLAPHVEHLTAIDISPTAIRRASARCAGLGNVQFQVLDFVADPLPADLDLILCSEVLYYLPLDYLRNVAPKIASSVKPGGHLLLAHGNLIADDRTRCGFDWGHPFGATTIGHVFCSLPEVALVKELRTPLYTIHLFRRPGAADEKEIAAAFSELSLPPDLVLAPELEKSILWDGAVTTRAEARQREVATELPILLYHSIADDGPEYLAPFRVTPLAFREQLRYLRRHGFYSITLPEWAACLKQKLPLPGRPVILTFDDGYADFFTNAWPALQRADFSATVFVVTEKVGGIADWDIGSGKPLKLMDWEELRALHAEGIAIGSHSATHKDLSALSPVGVFWEGERARTMLREKLGIDAEMIAFPWGRGVSAVESTLARCGYTIGVTTEARPSTLEDDPLNLPRIEIFGHDDIDAFARKVSGKDAQPAMLEAGRNRDSSVAMEVLSREQGNARTARFKSSPIDPARARTLEFRRDELVGELVRLQNELLSSAGCPATLQKRLDLLFTQPVTRRTARAVRPETEFIPGVKLSFDERAQVIFSIEPKVDHTLSPETFMNKIGLDFSGLSEWLSLEVSFEWTDLSLAERFQICLYAEPSRSVNCQVAVRFPRKAGPPLENTLATFDLQTAEGNSMVSGILPVPDFIELNKEEKPQLLLFFDTETDLSLIIHYMNIYFV
jgi:peptidoglycan/xylan/chitin deacetylase (PgdA/CDA1 family)